MTAILSRRVCLLILLAAASGLARVSHADETATVPDAATGRFVDRVYRDADGDHKYVVFEPAGYSPAKKWPLIFYLHGASGRGRDGRAQLVVGLGPAVKARASTLPFLVVFPQNENMRSRLLGGWTDGSNELPRALKILDEVEKTYSVDRSHETLIGVSMGAFGAWSVAASSPERWKAMIAISGGGEPGFVPALAKVPIWAFHAADDRLVPPTRSTDLVDAINAAGGRAFVSIRPTGGHNIGAPVLARDEIFEFLAHPDRDPVTKIDWNKTFASADMTNEIPFVPGADVASAVRIQINRDLLESLSYLAPSQLPGDALSGWKPGRQEQRGLGRSTTVGDTFYNGAIERAWITPLANGRLRVQVGIRNLTMTISGAHVTGPLMTADAGPLPIYIGYQEPVWLSMDLNPRIVDRRLKLDLENTQFQIPDHNWSISRPNVNVRGLPMMEDRIADRLVEGVSEKKAEIERSIRDKIPQMLAQLEARVGAMCERTVTQRNFPMPLWQPRFRFYPESIRVTEQGLELTLGALVAALAPRSNNLPILPFPAMGEAPPQPITSGMDVAISLQLFNAYAALLSNSDVARFHVLDMNGEGFRRLGSHEFWNSVLPPDQQLAPSTELNTEFVLAKPFRVQPEKTPPQGMGKQLSLVIPQLRLQLASRAMGESAWTDRAVVDLGFSQGIKLEIGKPSFSWRKMNSELEPIAAPSVDAHWLGADNSVQLNDEKISETFREGWSSNFGATERDGKMKDVKLGQLVLRWDEIGTTDSHIVVRLLRPGIRLHNPGDQPVAYQVRSLVSPWSQVHTLPGGEFHEFRPPTPITWRLEGAPVETQYLLPLGFEANVRRTGESGTIQLFEKVDLIKKSR